MTALPLEQLLEAYSERAALFTELVAVLVITWGVVEAVVRVIRRLGKHWTLVEHGSPLINLGRWLVLGLQFTLAADIIKTAVAPTWEDIGQLGAIAAIRTFLNFFLTRDLSVAAAWREGQQGVAAGAPPDGRLPTQLETQNTSLSPM